ncbi:MAG TPA: multidrug effflux MFS transporter [Candidatus Wallbacteria bacterium]|nr:multidrug effflux MFS transporter [Candidatus Wallbacteria bacterium]
MKTKKNKLNKKTVRTLLLVLGGLAALGPFSIDMYLPGFAAMAGDLNCGMQEVGYSLTAYFIGICFGQLIYGPLTDRYGRKLPVLAGLAIYTISSAICASVNNIHALIAMRLFQALGGAAGMVSGRAIVRDLFPTSLVAKFFSSLMLVMGAAPIIAPIAGGAVIPAFGWRSIFIILTVFGCLMFIAVTRYLPESKSPDPSVSLAPGRIFKNYFEVLKNREFMINGFASGALGASLLAYISGSPFVFMKLFGLSEKQFSWLYAVNAFGLIAGSQLNHFLLRRFNSRTITIYAAALQLTANFMLLAAASNINACRPLFYILIFIILSLCGILNPNTVALALKPVGKAAGSGSSILGFIQMTSGTFATFAVSVLHNGTVFPMVVTLAGLSFTGVLLLITERLYTARQKSL